MPGPSQDELPWSFEPRQLAGTAPSYFIEDRGIAGLAPDYSVVPFDHTGLRDAS
jgi:hypothetical protein